MANLSDVVNLTFVRFGDFGWACFVFSQPAYIIPQSNSIVKFLAVQALEVLGQNCGVLKVVGVGLQLVCVMVLKPQGVVSAVAPHLVCPTVAVALDGVFAAVGVELICNHLLTFRCF
jgi:hypothetical protein